MAVVGSTVILVQCLKQGWCEHIRVIWIQRQEKTEMNSRHQQNVSFNGYSNEETLNVNKTS